MRAHASSPIVFNKLSKRDLEVDVSSKLDLCIHYYVICPASVVYFLNHLCPLHKIRWRNAVCLFSWFEIYVYFVPRQYKNENYCCWYSPQVQQGTRDTQAIMQRHNIKQIVRTSILEPVFVCKQFCCTARSKTEQAQKTMWCCSSYACVTGCIALWCRSPHPLPF